MRAQTFSHGMGENSKSWPGRQKKISKKTHSPTRRVHVCARRCFPIGLNGIAVRLGGTACSQAVFIGTGPRSARPFSPGGAVGVSRRREPPVRGARCFQPRRGERMSAILPFLSPLRGLVRGGGGFRGLTAPAKFLRPFGAGVPRSSGRLLERARMAAAWGPHKKVGCSANRATAFGAASRAGRQIGAARRVRFRSGSSSRFSSASRPGSVRPSLA